MNVTLQNFLSNCTRSRHDAAIRVVQSVALVAHLPAILFTNACGALVLSLVLTGAPGIWYQFLPVIVIWALLLPSLLSYLRLRTRSTPPAVSQRRLRRIVQYSTFLGTAWALLMLTLLPTQPPPVVMLMVAGLAFMCVGGTAVMSNNPLACLGYSLPIFAAGLFIAATQTFQSHWVLVFVLMLLGFGIFWILSSGMQPALEILSLKSERTGLVEDLEEQLKTQAALIASYRTAQSELAVSEARFRALALLSSDWYWEQDAQFRFIEDPSGNSALYLDFRKSLVSKTRWDAAPDNPESVWEKHREDLLHHRKFTEFEYQIDVPARGRRWFSVSGEPRFDDKGRLTGYVGVGKDITDRKASEEAVYRLAHYDVLTDLPNRRFLIDTLTKLQAGCKRNGFLSAVIFFDLDHFKDVNDARGHETGDQVLKCIAERLRTLVRIEDTAARLGGDEFVVLMSNSGREVKAAAEAALTMANRIRAEIAAPIHINGHTYIVGCSIGVTLFPAENETPADLLRQADTAMYQAKASGRNQTVFFEAAMQQTIEERLTLEYELSQACPLSQLSLYLQPQVDRAGETIGGELLLRWQHPVHGFIAPSVFIPLAEKSNLILELGTWVLNQACAISVRLAAAGHPLTLSINVSPRQFRQQDFVELVRTALKRSGAQAKNLIFEVTEGLMIDDVDATVSKMHELTALGIRFSIDDFGTGYSSLAYLKRLPIYELKIDRSFVQDLLEGADTTAIVEAMLSMAKHLHLHVVAEGVETQEQAEFLNRAGCDSSQGYLYARPMPVDIWLENRTMLSEVPVPIR